MNKNIKINSTNWRGTWKKKNTYDISLVFDSINKVFKLLMFTNSMIIGSNLLNCKYYFIKLELRLITEYKISNKSYDKNKRQMISNLLVWIERLELFWKANDSTCYSCTWVSSFQWLLVSFFTQIVLFRMNNNWASNYRMLSKERDNVILEAHVRVSKRIRNQISEISNMSLFLERSTMVFSERIEMSASSGAAIG